MDRTSPDDGSPGNVPARTRACEDASLVRYDAVVTAGGRVGGAFAASIGTPVKALAPFCGAPLASRAIAAARAAGCARIALIGGKDVRAALGSLVDSILDESPDGAENVRRALFAWGGRTPLLYLTSDLPFITAAALRCFLDRVPAGSLALPLADAHAFERRFPGAPPFGVRLAGERVVNGGVFAIPGEAAGPVAALAAKLFEARKRPWRMAGLLGPRLFARFALRRLCIARLEFEASRRLQVPALAVRAMPPELAYDVDDLETYRYACTHA